MISDDTRACCRAHVGDDAASISNTARRFPAVGSRHCIDVNPIAGASLDESGAARSMRGVHVDARDIRAAASPRSGA